MKTLYLNDGSTAFINTQDDFLHLVREKMGDDALAFITDTREEVDFLEKERERLERDAELDHEFWTTIVRDFAVEVDSIMTDILESKRINRQNIYKKLRTAKHNAICNL